MEANKITDLFRRLSFRDGNMISPGENSFSFRVDDLPSNIPKDVHFTFGYNKETGDINLHATRNVPGVAPKDKPQVRVAIFHKDAITTALPGLVTKLVKLHLMPLAFFSQRKKSKYREYQQRRFLDLSAIEKWSDYREGEFLPEAARHIKKKSGGKGKYEMLPSFGPAMEQWSRTKFRMKTVRAAIKPLREIDITQNVWGFLLSAEYNGPAIIANGRIYIVQTGIDPGIIAQALLGKATAEQLVQKIGEAIHRVQHAKTNTDTRDAGDPIRLFNQYADAGTKPKANVMK